MKPLVLGALSVVFASSVASAQTDFVAEFSGASGATGTATLTLNETEDALTYSITLVGVDLDGLQTMEDAEDDLSAIHFHRAPAGVNGPVVFGLVGPAQDADDLVIDPGAGTLSGVWEEADLASSALSAELVNLHASGLYINVHTNAFPGGATRGQVIPILFADGFESGGVGEWSSASP